MEYYPKRKRLSELCVSEPKLEGVFEVLGATNYTIGDSGPMGTTVIDAHGKNVSYYDWITNLDWYLPDTQGDRFAMVKNYENYLKNQPQGIFCNIADDTDPNWVSDCDCIFMFYPYFSNHLTSKPTKIPLSLNHWTHLIVFAIDKNRRAMLRYYRRQ